MGWILRFAAASFTNLDHRNADKTSSQIHVCVFVYREAQITVNPVYIGI